MISIIIPVFKENEYLPRTLKNLAQQTIIKDCEIILSEYNPDFSPYTTDVAEEFQRKSKIPTYVRMINRSGIAHARNEGVLASKGQFIVNFDADSRFNRKDALAEMVMPLRMSSTQMTICDNEFDYVGLPKKEFKNMEIPQKVLDYINYAQTAGYPILEPGSCFNVEAFVEVGGFNDCLQWELSRMGPRFMWKFPGKIKHVPGVSVIVSPRRALKLRELGLGTLNYTNAIRGDNQLNIY